MSPGMVVERREIWSLSSPDPWHPTIRWFADAVADLRSRDGADRADPTSWGHLAAIHGTDDPKAGWPAGALWDQCQHHTWYFLPWHRIYLHHFETIVRAAVVALGGPGDWALPFWDYSVASKRRLPPAFLSELRPNGDPNPLFTPERSRRMKLGRDLRWNQPEWDETFAMKQFVIRARPGSKAFGGPRTGWFHGDEVNVDHPQGEIELYPHNDVHGQVGGRAGWMSAFDTAPLDPVFWLHHANVDRLWEVWLRSGGERSNPDEPSWLNEQFAMGSGQWTTSMTVQQTLDTTAAPLHYRYAGVPAAAPAREVAAARAAGQRPAEAMMDEGPPPELVGATESTHALGDSPSTAVVSLREPTGPVAGRIAEAARPPRVYLGIEHVKGRGPLAPSYLVHVNLPDGADPGERDDLLAGTMPMFGVRESSAKRSEHGRGGLSFTFDITDVVGNLRRQGAWDPTRLEVTFTPDVDADDAEDAEAGSLSVGRISVYYE